MDEIFEVPPGSLPAKSLMDPIQALLPFSRFLIDPSKRPGPLRRVAGRSVFNGVFRISVRPPPHGSSLLDTRIFYRSPVCPYESEGNEL